MSRSRPTFSTKAIHMTTNLDIFEKIEKFGLEILGSYKTSVIVAP